jgi:hypothetical protein
VYLVLIKKIALILSIILILQSCSFTSQNFTKNLQKIVDIPITQYPILLVSTANNGRSFALLESHKIYMYEQNNNELILLSINEMPRLYNPSFMFLDQSKNVTLIDNELPIRGQFPFADFLYGEEYLNSFVLYQIPFKGNIQKIPLENPYISFIDKKIDSEKYLFDQNSLYYLYSPIIQFQNYSLNFRSASQNFAKPGYIRFPNDIIEFKLNNHTKKVFQKNSFALIGQDREIIRSFDIGINCLAMLVEKSNAKREIRIIDRQSKEKQKTYSVNSTINNVYLFNQKNIIVCNNQNYFLLKDNDQYVKIAPASWQIIKDNTSIFFAKTIKTINEKNITIYKLIYSNND